MRSAEEVAEEMVNALEEDIKTWRGYQTPFWISVKQIITAALKARDKEGEERVKELEKRIETLDNIDRMVKDRFELLDLRHRCSEFKERIAQLEAALELILPLAKGYAAQHPVGSNQEYVNHAESLASPSARGAQ